MAIEGFHIRTAKFPVLPGENDLVLNPGTHGQALAEHLKSQLEQRGYEVPYVGSEDFGWWIQIKLSGISVGVVCSRAHGDPGVADFGIRLPAETRKWSWRRFRFINLESYLENLANQILQIVEADEGVELVATNLDSYPPDAGDLNQWDDAIQDEDDRFEVRPQERWFTIFGSRVLFILLAPWLLLAVALFGAMTMESLVGEETQRSWLIGGVLTLVCLSGLLIGVSPRHFGWMIVIITTVIPLAYVWYFYETYFVEGQSLTLTGGKSDASPANAILGFCFFGIPCLVFTWRRVKSWLPGRKE